jgi:hypothetical protein
MAESIAELNEAVSDLRTVLIHEFAASRVARFLGWFYEWERPRIGDRLAKVATLVLAANILWLWPIAIIEWLLGMIGVGR